MSLSTLMKMRSPILRYRTEAVAEVARKTLSNLPNGCSVVVEPIIFTTSGRESHRSEASFLGFRNGEKWKPPYGDVIGAHVNLKDTDSKTIVQVVCKGFGLGKPQIHFDDRRVEPKSIALGLRDDIQSAGLFLTKPKMNPRIEPREFQYRLATITVP